MHVDEPYVFRKWKEMFQNIVHHSTLHRATFQHSLHFRCCLMVVPWTSLYTMLGNHLNDTMSPRRILTSQSTNDPSQTSWMLWQEDRWAQLRPHRQVELPFFCIQHLHRSSSTEVCHWKAKCTCNKSQLPPYQGILLENKRLHIISGCFCERSIISKISGGSGIFSAANFLVNSSA